MILKIILLAAVITFILVFAVLIFLIIRSGNRIEKTFNETKKNCDEASGIVRKFLRRR